MRFVAARTGPSETRLTIAPMDSAIVSASSAERVAAGVVKRAWRSMVRPPGPGPLRLPGRTVTVPHTARCWGRYARRPEGGVRDPLLGDIVRHALHVAHHRIDVSRAGRMGNARIHPRAVATPRLRTRGAPRTTLRS